jgi:hypothetical protein
MCLEAAARGDRRRAVLWFLALILWVGALAVAVHVDAGVASHLLHLIA